MNELKIRGEKLTRLTIPSYFKSRNHEKNWKEKIQNSKFKLFFLHNCVCVLLGKRR
jgi:hypothetical protein